MSAGKGHKAGGAKLGITGRVWVQDRGLRAQPPQGDPFAGLRLNRLAGSGQSIVNS